jgi:hypothetical protein
MAGLSSLTSPVAIAGKHHPISLYEVLAANAVTYALIAVMWNRYGTNCITRNNSQQRTTSYRDIAY